MTAAAEQPPPNALEVAILEAFTRERPALVVDAGHLQVRGRKFTGVGSYTDFVCESTGERETVSLAAPIAVPGIRRGIGAALVCRGRHPECLEVFTRGDELWEGGFEGFSIG